METKVFGLRLNAADRSALKKITQRTGLPNETESLRQIIRRLASTSGKFSPSDISIEPKKK